MVTLVTTPNDNVLCISKVSDLSYAKTADYKPLLDQLTMSVPTVPISKHH